MVQVGFVPAQGSTRPLIQFSVRAERPWLHLERSHGVSDLTELKFSLGRIMEERIEENSTPCSLVLERVGIPTCDQGLRRCVCPCEDLDLIAGHLDFPTLSRTTISSAIQYTVNASKFLAERDNVGTYDRNTAPAPDRTT